VVQINSSAIIFAPQYLLGQMPVALTDFLVVIMYHCLGCWHGEWGWKSVVQVLWRCL